MKRIFIKPAKKNPKFWEIEVNGKSYAITEGQTNGNSETIAKDFSDEVKCMKSAANLIEKIREKGYMEKLAEHNKAYPTYLNYPGSGSDIPIPVGVTAAAVLAIFNGSKYDKLIASFLNTIKAMEWYPISCSTMRNLWKDSNVTPDVPETISIMTPKTK